MSKGHPNSAISIIFNLKNTVLRKEMRINHGETQICHVVLLIHPIIINLSQQGSAAAHLTS